MLMETGKPPHEHTHKKELLEHHGGEKKVLKKIILYCPLQEKFGL